MEIFLIFNIKTVLLKKMNTKSLNLRGCFLYLFIVFVAVILVAPETSYTQPQGRPVSTAINNQINPVITTDDNGGAYNTWKDHRNAGNSDIYSQRILSTEAINWTVTDFPITTLVNDQLSPGSYETTWNASKIASGIYFYRLHTSEYTETKRMALIK